MEEQYRLGLIGLGRVAWLLEQDPLRGKPCSHMGAWMGHPRIELVAGCDTDPERRAAFAAAYPQARLYRSYEKMLARERLDLLSVAAYADQRCDMVLAAARCGVRGIWCEKAMASSLKEARKMKRALRAHDSQMILSYMRRWDARYQRVRQLLQEGAIGQLESINIQFPGNMLHTGTHAFDLVRMMAGEVQSVQAWLDDRVVKVRQSGYRFGKRARFKDFGGFALLRMKSGARVTVQGFSKDYFRFEFELLGSRGMIRIGNSQTELWQVAPSGRFTGFSELDRVAFPDCSGPNAWFAARDNLLAAIEQRQQVACGVRDGARSLAIALAMHVSHQQGHRPVRPKDVPLHYQIASR
jgi:predicted dehydrogenase